MQIKTAAEFAAEGKSPELLFWVGCAGSIDDRAIRVTKAMAKILKGLNIEFAILGAEESCTGDPAKRAGNEFLFQMLATQNIQILNSYGIRKILTTCPHCFNVMKNEYPGLGGNYEVLHHSEFLQQMIDTGKLRLKNKEQFKGKKITFHDSCYLGRGNGIYQAPRRILQQLDADLAEMSANKERGMCCGAGGAQMFKEDEPGNSRVNTIRTAQALQLNPDVIAVSCPFCMTMMTDGVKAEEKQEQVKVLDLAELIASGQGISKDVF